MVEFLTKHLYDKIKAHPSLEMLGNQWGFDKNLIPKALQNVGRLFTHYSRHDESHSKQILINIERLRENNIELLSATDTWLLLEAAYWHDIGMVVSKKDIDEAVTKPEFSDYLSRIRSDITHELNKFAMKFDINDPTGCFSGAETPMDGVAQFGYLFSEWFRMQHAERSEQIVHSPWQTIGVSSPRTELIPKRLFRILGAICHMHGLPFSKIMAVDGLPFREAGIGQEDCHPRFVACLLRMGDLLDLDDNRFCPVMQKIAGDSRPSLSFAHEDKHASIKRLRINADRIEITAECDTIDGYLETFKWFDWLKGEIHNQMANWRDIVPNRALGLLPTLGQMSVRLSGDLQILSEGTRPQFSLESSKAISLLQGKNLYDSKFSSIREILQNAIDATLIKLWLTCSEKEQKDLAQGPFLQASVRILNSLPISISITEMSECAESSDSLWNVTIRDSGTGIGRQDLSYMLRIGGSDQNTWKQSQVDRMPEWMKPSGAFGIGFQSIFMITDKVTLKTKSIRDNQTISLDMYSPLSSKGGLVIIRNLENIISEQPGTEISFVIKVDKITDAWTIDPENKNSVVSEFIRWFDPVLEVSFPLDAAQIADRVETFSKFSPVPVKGNFKSLKYDDAIELGSYASTWRQDDGWRFVRVKEEQLTLAYQPQLERNVGRIETFYRGQSFSNDILFAPFVSITVNLLSGKAGSWLTANRQNLSSAARLPFRQLVLNALMTQVEIDTNGDTLQLIDRDKQREFSIFLESMAILYGSSWEPMAKRLQGLWKDLCFSASNCTYREFLNGQGGVVSDTPSQNELPGKGHDLLIDDTFHDVLKTLLFRNWQSEFGGTIKITLAPAADEIDVTQTGGSLSSIDIRKHYLELRRFKLNYDMKKTPQEYFTREALAARLFQVSRIGSGNERFTLECGAQWKGLALKDETVLRAGNTEAL